MLTCVIRYEFHVSSHKRFPEHASFQLKYNLICSFGHRSFRQKLKMTSLIIKAKVKFMNSLYFTDISIIQCVPDGDPGTKNIFFMLYIIIFSKTMVFKQTPCKS